MSSMKSLMNIVVPVGLVFSLNVFAITGDVSTQLNRFLESSDPMPAKGAFAGQFVENVKSRTLVILSSVADFIVIHHRLSFECTSGAAAT